MSKQAKALANAERVADEAIDLLSRLANKIIDLSEKGAMNHELRRLADLHYQSAQRLRNELEGEPV